MPVLKPVMRRAALGDVAVLRLNTAYPTTVDGEPQVYERTLFLVSRVTDVHPNGAVAAVADPRFDHDPDQPPLSLAHLSGLEKIFVVPHERIDVDAALATARAHNPAALYDTLDEVGKAINRYRH
ncbi:hypothetical protein ACPCBF_25050 [Streptomyces pseudogriseolus]|uniref:hypothetical protein n=1 Tax=Streptomyces pseudogriseolus TaxID=36817 RepID=UPI003FA2E8AF